MLKAFFVLKIFKFLSWLFDHAGKQLDKKAKVHWQNKQLQYTYCPISKKIKAMKQLNLVS